MRIIKGVGKLGKTVYVPAISKDVKGTILFLHGSMDTGIGFSAWMNQLLKQEFTFNHFNVLYPTAPIVPYALHDGKSATVWFNRLNLSHCSPEDTASIDDSCHELSKFIQAESLRSGVPISRTVIGGFAMGGAISLHIGFRFLPQIAGIFTLSSFLPLDSSVFKAVEKREGKNKIVKKSRRPKIFMSQGLVDPIVHPRWTKATFQKLQKHGVEGHYYSFEKQGHFISRDQLGLLHGWLNNLLVSTHSSQPTMDVTDVSKKPKI